jgi:OTU domain-containing protein 3
LTLTPYLSPLLPQNKQKAKGKRFGKDEEQRFEQQVAELGARITIMASDGNCLFRALADQLRGRPQDHGEIRQHIVDFMEEHEDEFAPFVEDDEKWVDYIPRMRTEGEWGGQQEICAASRCFRINVVIHQMDNPRLEIAFKVTAETVHLSFHGAAHYNSIRAMDDPCREGEPAKAFMALTATPSAASTSSIFSSASASSSSSSPLRPKKSKNQRLQEASDREVEPQEQEEDGNSAGGEGPDGSADGHADENDGEGEAEEGTEAGTTAKVGGQCPCGSGKKWRKCCRKAERQRERFRSGALGNGQQHAQGQGQRPPQRQQRDDYDDREGTGVLTQKLAAIAL